MRKILYGVLGTLALGLASCSSDEPVKAVDQKVDKDQTRYITVSLCNPTNYMSRADFEDGAVSESAVKSIWFVFYDGSGAPTAQHWIPTATDLASGWTDVNTNTNVTRFWTSTIPVNMTQGQNKPVYVMAYINPIDTRGLTTMTLSEIDAATRDAISGTDGFAMSNSVYYGDNPITGQSNVRMMATPIVGDQLCSTEAEAQANPIDIYVERYAAKIGLTMAPNAINAYDVMIAGATPEEAMTAGQIKFTPIYWRPNAVDLTTYITKAFSTSLGQGGDNLVPATWANLNTAFTNTGMQGATGNGQGIAGWNDADNFRSYWACSPSYYAGAYPQCSDDITDKMTGENATYPYEIKYFTFSELENKTEGDPIVWDATNGFTTTTTGAGYFYSRETTASIEDITATDKNNKAVVASAAIVGKYQLTTATGTPTTFYLYGKSGGKDVYYTGANIEQALISNQNVIFTNQQGTIRATNTDFFVVKHPSQKVRNNQNVAGRLVTIQIDEENIPATPLYFYDGDNFVQINTDNVIAANQLLWASASTAQKFHEGLAFFAIPIRHLGWGKNVPDDKPLLSSTTVESGRPSTINWQNLRRGDLGVVRNHVYNIEVTGVTGLGVGLENVNQPMVPPMDPDNYYVAARLNILSWRVVPTQEVTL